ncbi:retrotransposon-like protein [Tanacetum coccineum]
MKEASGSSQLSSVVTGLEIPTIIGTTRKKPLTPETHTESITPRPRGRQRIGSRLNDMTLVSFEIGSTSNSSKIPSSSQNTTGLNSRMNQNQGRLQGENYHIISDLMVKPNEKPKFAQLYIFDTQNELQNRIDVVSACDDENIKLRLIGGRYCDGRQHNLPTSSEVAALIVGDFDTFKNKRDIVLHKHSEDGYRTDIFHKGVIDFTPTNKKTRVSMHEWFAYRIQESPRVLASLASTSDGSRVLHRKKYVLPATFTGSPRYMLQNYLDAMSICKFYEYTDPFITFTCNPSWPEISRYMAEKGLKSEDRPDATTRTVKKSGTDLDNGFVVPYNLGPDRVTAAVDDEEVDEINDYYDCMYLSSCEASWRIFQFDIHHRTPSVERLPFYLPDEHSVIFDEFDSIDYVLEKDSNNTTKFLQWMERNKIDDKARELLYVQFPTKYVWKA